jgi:hypothetical protein
MLTVHDGELMTQSHDFQLGPCVAAKPNSERRKQGYSPSVPAMALIHHSQVIDSGMSSNDSSGSQKLDGFLLESVDAFDWNGWMTCPGIRIESVLPQYRDSLCENRWLNRRLIRRFTPRRSRFADDSVLPSFVITAELVLSLCTQCT